jgi:hypothetical protein
MEFLASFLDKIFARQPPAHGCINALWQTRRSHSTQSTIAQAFARRNALRNCSQCAAAREGGLPAKPGIFKGFRHGRCGAGARPFFKGWMFWHEPGPAKGKRSEMPGVKKNRACAAGGKSLAK